MGVFVKGWIAPEGCGEKSALLKVAIQIVC